MKRKVYKLINNTLGSLFLFLALVGAVLPLIPATPFLILAGFFFSRGSPHFHHWLLTHKYLGPPIRDWQQRGVIRRDKKIIGTVMMMLSSFFLYPNPQIPAVGKITFAIFTIALLGFLWTRPSK